jgi:group I intron endonuclease
MRKEYNSIYMIKSISNGNFYIGSAIHFFHRKTKHLSLLRLNKHHNIFLQNHANKYGIEDLEFSVLEEVASKQNLLIREQFYIDTFNPSFNICKTAGSALGIKRSLETIEKHKNRPAWNKGQKTPEHVKQKMSDSKKGLGKGKKLLEETKAKIREARLNQPCPSYGKRSDEAKEKMRKAHLGKKPSQETRLKMSESQRKRKQMSPETRKKLSESNKGNRNKLGWKAPESTKLKQSIAITNHYKRLRGEIS